jgi:non-heme chloroperoxidase
MMNGTKVLRIIAALIAVLVILTGAAIALGGPKPIAPMASINDPFEKVDFSNLPPLQRYAGADGTSLAYRQYAPATGAVRGSVVLVHGSSGSSSSVDAMAKAFAKAGYAAYALDIRGHGQSGPKGQIAYVGQLEDDMAAFMKAAAPRQPSTLVGFSSGGGFALRVAAGPRQDLFQSYLLLSPYIGHDAPTSRPASGGWVSVGIPRFIGISLMNQVGIHRFDALPVIAFALNDKARAILTPEYSYALTVNFGPHRDYAADIKAVRRPCALIAGDADEAFRADQFEPLLRGYRRDWPVMVLPGIGHIPLTLDARALEKEIEVVGWLQAKVGA